MEKKTFSLPAIAATLGSLLAGKVGASVKFADVPTAMTDGKIVYLSSRLKTGASEDEAHILRGFLAHEILGHVHHTDFKEMVAWKEMEKSQLAHAILNVIEDGRIERASWRTFPAVKSILNRCVDALLREGKCFSDPSGKTPPEGIITGLLLSHVRKNLGQNLDPAKFEALAFPLFGEELCRKIVEIALRGANSPAGLAGHKGTIEATQEIIDLLRQAGQDQDQGQGQGQSGQGQNQSGQGQGQGQDQVWSRSRSRSGSVWSRSRSRSGSGWSRSRSRSGSGSVWSRSRSRSRIKVMVKDQSGQGQGQGQDQVGQGQGQTRDQGQVDAAKAALEGKNPGMSDLGGAMLSILTDKPKDGDHFSKVITRDLRTTDMTIRKISVNEGGLPDLDAKAAANRLGAKLEQLLEDRTNHRDVYGEDGRLCGRRLVSAMSGEQKVFRRASGENQGLDVAVSLMIDCSGSMQGKEMNLAKATGYAVAEALSKYESQGVTLEVFGFNDSIFRIKEFGESFPSRSRCFAALEASGGTRFQETLTQSVKKIALRKEARKIVIFITDGDLGVDPAVVVNTLKTEGVEMRGVLVGEENENFFLNAEIKHFGMAKNASNIPSAVFKAMEKDFF
ncbi:vWA domain-containing protein [Ferrovum myxofaciens]|uniref:vWA domain-containing protein n=1 Tax=Ferrovum myxofaciens TaxID=416213 RepID=UPI003EBF345B